MARMARIEAQASCHFCQPIYVQRWYGPPLEPQIEWLGYKYYLTWDALAQFTKWQVSESSYWLFWIKVDWLFLIKHPNMHAHAYIHLWTNANGSRNTCNGTILITGWRQSSTCGTSITLPNPPGHADTASPFEHMTIKRPLRAWSCWMTDCCLLSDH